MKESASAKNAPTAGTQDIDKHVADRIRERRIMLGLTQQQMADLMGVTSQQVRRYEAGINRLAAGRLYQMAELLGVDVGFFFGGLKTYSTQEAEMLSQQHMLLDIARNFISITDRRKQYVICSLARALAEEIDEEDEEDGDYLIYRMQRQDRNASQDIDEIYVKKAALPMRDALPENYEILKENFEQISLALNEMNKTLEDQKRKFDLWKEYVGNKDVRRQKLRAEILEELEAKGLAVS